MSENQSKPEETRPPRKPGFFRRMWRRVMLTREQWRENRIAFALCLLSGFAGIFIFPGYHSGLLAWVVLIPYFVALRQLRGKALVWGTYIFGFTWQYLTLFWLNTLTIFHPLIPVGILIAGFLEATYFLMFAFAANFAMRRLPALISPFVIAAAWAGMEYTRSFTDVALPWNLLAHSQALHGGLRPLMQIADVTGVFGISFLVALFNAINAQLITGIVERRCGRAILRVFSPVAYGLSLALIVACVVVGVHKFGQWLSTDPEGKGLRVALIQPNVSQLDKVESYERGISDERRWQLEIGMIRKQFAMMDMVAAESTTDTRPQLYVLPESAVSEAGFVYDKPLHNKLRELADFYGADIFFGADNRVPLTDYTRELRRGFRKPGTNAELTTQGLPEFKTRVVENGTTQPYEDAMAVFNSAWLVKQGTGLAQQVYNKIQLVPFGETAPIVGMIPWFEEKVMMIGSYQKGLQFTIFQTAGVKYGALICFESAFAQLARGLALNGAQMLCVLTNDGWYDPHYLINAHGFWGALFRVPIVRQLAASGPEQHYVHSLYRAIETRLPVLRAANTGISAIIAPTGRELERREYGTQATIVRAVAPGQHEPTWYVKHGDVFAGTCAIVMFAAILWSIAESYARHRRA